MANDSNQRYRGNHPPAGGGADPYRDGPADDPLAELARLIGQNDPFADFGQAPQQRQPYQAPQQAQAREIRQAADSRHDAEPRRVTDPRPVTDMRYDPAARRPVAPPPQNWPDEPAQRPAARAIPAEPPQSWPDEPVQRPAARAIPSDERPRRPPLSSIFPAQDPLRNAAARQAAEYVPHTNQPLPDPDDALPMFASRQRAQPAIPPDFGPDPVQAQGDAGFAVPPAEDHYDDRTYQPDPQLALAGEDDYDDPPRGRRRGGLVLVVAVLGLAVVGTAGAFAFRSMFTDGKSDGGSRVILADTNPTKIVPDTSGTETGSTKTIYDRINDRGQTERVVPREEQPVEVKDPSRSNFPRVVFPGAPNIPVQSAPPAANVVGSNERSVNGISTAPKRVRTITIRPGAPVGAPVTAVTPTVSSPPVARNEPSRRSAADDDNDSRTVVASTDRSPPPARQPERAQPSSSAPLSIAPRGNDDSPPAAAPSRVASAPASGGFAVQISSQRSQNEARAAFRSLQSRFSSVLGGQQSFVRRVDLGSRGVYYRTLIGPFGSVNEASAFCSRLKAAGGQCIIQRN